jgi:hypothetical protein
LVDKYIFEVFPINIKYQNDFIGKDKGTVSWILPKPEMQKIILQQIRDINQNKGCVQQVEFQSFGHYGQKNRLVQNTKTFNLID